MFQGEFKPEHGHGRLFCSCGKVLSICGCHTDYKIKIKACKKCARIQDKQIRKEQKLLGASQDKK